MNGRALLFIVGYLMLAAIYAVATPPFEASDELPHYEMIRYIRNRHTLPVQDPANRFTPWEQEGSQPPLYYALVAAVTSPLDIGATPTYIRNPHAKLGLPAIKDNRNRVIREHYPATAEGDARIVYVARVFSILLSVGTIVCVYATANLIAPGGVAALIAAGITAFNPMFLFISASVNNDNLVIMLNSVVIYLLVRTLRDGFDNRRSALIAVLIAFATLSKLSGLVLIPVVAVSALWLAYVRKDWRGLVFLGAAMALMWALIAGWWYLRNFQLYGEPFGTQMMVKIAGPRPEPFTLSTLLDEFEGFRITYWALFGMVNILTFSWFYKLMDAVTLFATAGLLLFAWRWWRMRDTASDEHRFVLSAVLALLAILLIASASLINWTAQTFASQGRLLFPFVTATSTLFGLGLAGLVKMAERIIGPVYIAGAGVGALVFIALVVPFASIMPVYAIPNSLHTMPDQANPIFARFGDIELIGYISEQRRYEPGDHIPVTVYWRPVEPSDRDYSLFIHLIDADGDVVGKVDSYPGGGLLRTTTWAPGVVYADSYGVPIDQDANGSYQMRLKVGWWYAPESNFLEARDQTGADIGSVLLDAGGFVGGDKVEYGDFQATDPIDYGGVIGLRGFRIEENRLTLLWKTLAIPDDDYVVFVQALDANDVIAAQGDAPPRLPTHYWRPGEEYITIHEMQPVGSPTQGPYHVVVGWYRLGDFYRLQTDLPNSAYELTTLQ